MRLQILQCGANLFLVKEAELTGRGAVAVEHGGFDVPALEMFLEHLHRVDFLALVSFAFGGAAFGDAGRGNGALGPAIRGGVLTSGGVAAAAASAAVPRAAGIVDEGRGAGDAAARGATGLGAADGDSIAISTVRPTKPMITAAKP